VRRKAADVISDPRGLDTGKRRSELESLSGKKTKFSTGTNVKAMDILGSKEAPEIGLEGASRGRGQKEVRNGKKRSERSLGTCRRERKNESGRCE
jgi:hypothetical protein